jgi:uncharacterized protein YutD
MIKLVLHFIFAILILIPVGSVAELNMQSYQWNTNDRRFISEIFYKALGVLNSNPKVQAPIEKLMKREWKPFFDHYEDRQPDFVVRIKSAYWDESTKSWLNVVGMGTLISFDSKLALLTASHVSQGQKLRIQDSKGRLISVVAGERLADVSDDLELIVLRDDRSAQYTFDEALKVFKTQSVDIADDDIFEGQIYHAYGIDLKHHVAALYSEDLDKYAGDCGWENANFVLQAPNILVGQTLKEKAESIWNNWGEMSHPLVGQGVIGFSKMPPGFSGAPLIRHIPSADLIEKGLYSTQLEGLVLAQHRTEEKTFFADQKMILKLLTSFRNGQRNYVDVTRWRMSQGFLFRDYGNGVLETSFAKKPSANFFRQESGNAVSVDSGNAVSIDSGGGKVKAEPKLALGMQDGFGKNIVGIMLQKDGVVIPALATTSLRQEAKKWGFEVGADITQKTDLYELAKIKYQYVNAHEFKYAGASFQCDYKLDENGISLSLYNVRVNRSTYEITRTLRKTITLSRAELARGFDDNILRYQNISTSWEYEEVNLMGLFVTDIASASNFGSIDNIQGPTVNFKTQVSNTSCYKSNEERASVFSKFKRDYYDKTRRQWVDFYQGTRKIIEE